VDHLSPSLTSLERPLGESYRRLSLFDLTSRNNESTVAARPIGATKSGIREPDPSADYDDDERKHGASAR